MSGTVADSPTTLRELQPNSFIFERPRALPPSFCEEVIHRFEAQPEYQHEGRIGQTQGLDRDIKRTTDLVVSSRPEWQDIDQILFHSVAVGLQELREHFPYFQGPFKDLGYQVQRYRTGEYYQWHIDGGSHQFSQRQLVILWYLNDVPGPGGETEFRYQNIQVRPEQGKMVLFPPFWTHEHRAARVQQGVKYIATTWVVFA